jgi:photosystem II stability/assembly factor-like uncharacterized protein
MAEIREKSTSGSAARRTPMQRVGFVVGSTLPILIIAGLLYAGFFVKPKVEGISVQRPVVEKRDIFYGVAVPAPQTVWAAGNLGKIIRSDDGGKNWTQQPSTVSTHFHGIAAWDTGRAVAVGNRGTIVVTADGGKNWKKAGVPENVSAAKLLRVRVYPDGKAWAVGEMGTALFSSDFGTSWRAMSAGEDVAWNDVSAVNDTVWLVGEFGRMQVSRDGGANWKAVEGPVKSSLNAITFRNENDGVAVGTEGILLQTADAGATWRALPKVVDQHLFDLLWDDRQWIAIGDKGALIVAPPSADKWTDRSDVAGTGWHAQITGKDGRYMLAGYGVTPVNLAQANSSKPEVVK